MQPRFCHACGASGEGEDACNPRFTVPAVPVARTRMPATRDLPCLRCLRRGRACLQPTFDRACGAHVLPCQCYTLPMILLLSLTLNGQACLHP